MAQIYKICKSNIEEERSNKEEEPAGSPLLGPTSLSGTSSPPLSPAAKVDETIWTCLGVRKEIVLSRPEINTAQITYMRLSLLHPKASDYDGDSYKRLAFNMDMSINSNTQFQRLKWRLTAKRSEYYANLPEDWETDPAYGAAWDFYNSLTTNAWIGKACFRKTSPKEGMKLKMTPLTAMVAYMIGDVLHYQLWIESASVSGNITYNELKHYAGFSEPVHNMQPTAIQMLKV
jgi:hypothetical protein